MGMAFNRSVWINFQQCSELFCSVDDYNWDWSLLHVAQQCLPKLFGDPTNLKMKSKFILGALVLKAPRVFHIGEWYSLHYCFTLAALLKGLFCFSSGVHHRKANCGTDTSTLRKAETSLRSARKAQTLFPSTLKTKNMLGGTKGIRLKKGNGGWGDPRDRELCLSLTIFD
jgi:alpha-1,6-mannosyl-glycoprotein beta-1,2-N-acetylglucosaminyltransferase